MAAALGEKDGFPLGPQLFFAFSPADGFQPPRGGAAHICICAQRICSILCTWLIFYCIPQILEYNIVYQNN